MHFIVILTEFYKYRQEGFDKYGKKHCGSMAKCGQDLSGTQQIKYCNSSVSRGIGFLVVRLFRITVTGAVISIEDHETEELE